MFREIPFDPDLCETVLDGPSAAFRCPLAICSQTARLVNLVCRLEPGFDAAFFGRDFHEIAFEIEVISLDGASPSFATQDRRDAAGFLPPQARTTVVSLVAHGYELLIALLRPRFLLRVTKAQATLAKAMAKHEYLTRRLEALGYRVALTGTDRFGRCFWWMERMHE